MHATDSAVVGKLTLLVHVLQAGSVCFTTHLLQLNHISDNKVNVAQCLMLPPVFSNGDVHEVTGCHGLGCGQGQE